MKPSVEVAPSGSSVRLLDHASGRFLELTAAEGSVLAAHDGVMTMEQLTQRLQAAGQVLEVEQVTAILERVARAGFLAERAAPAPNAAAPLLITDQVPLFRPDLEVTRQEGAKGLMEVKDPVRGRSFSLYDFEVSIARMLNGRRTAEDVIHAAGRLGITVTLDSLRKFIRQLAAYRFLEEGGAATEDTDPQRKTWAPRQPWTSEIREFFQSALRLFRLGRLEEARGHLDALLQLDPANPEAVDLRARVMEQVETGTALALLFDDLHGPWDDTAPALAAASEPPAGPELPAFQDEFPVPAATEPPLPDEPAPPQAAAPEAPPDEWPESAPDAPPPTTSEVALIWNTGSDWGQVPTTSPPTPVAPVHADAPEEADVALDNAVPPTAPAPRPQGRRGLWLGGAAVVLLGLTALFPVTEVRRFKCELASMVLAEVTSPRPGRLVQWLVKDGSAVTAGHVVARLEQEALAQQVRQLGPRKVALEGQLGDLKARVAGASARAEASLAQAEAQLAQGVAQQAQLAQLAAQAGRAQTARARAAAQLRDTQASVESARKAGRGERSAALEEATAASRKADDWAARTDRARRQLKRVTRDVTRQAQAVEQARAAVARVSRRAEVDALRAQLDAVCEPLAAAEATLRASDVVAPLAGRVRIREPVGAEVGAGQAVAHVVEPLELAVTVRGGVPDGADLASAVLVLQGGRRQPVKVKATRWAVAPGGARQLELGVDNPEGTLGGEGLAVLEVPVGRRPLVLGLWSPPAPDGT
ncbi:MAG: biotin/lipoyl-binding protein [Deltaproteobacteria bacterium]|nr:biotin/lipoyl-binding protein [Deltaproteobacteria bacterium]